MLKCWNHSITTRNYWVTYYFLKPREGSWYQVMIKIQKRQSKKSKNPKIFEKLEKKCKTV